VDAEVRRPGEQKTGDEQDAERRQEKRSEARPHES
jgi:hypothetical protein